MYLCKLYFTLYVNFSLLFCFLSVAAFEIKDMFLEAEQPRVKKICKNILLGIYAWTKYAGQPNRIQKTNKKIVQKQCSKTNKYFEFLICCFFLLSFGNNKISIIWREFGHLMAGPINVWLELFAQLSSGPKPQSNVPRNSTTTLHRLARRINAQLQVGLRCALVCT